MFSRKDIEDFNVEDSRFPVSCHFSINILKHPLLCEGLGLGCSQVQVQVQVRVMIMMIDMTVYM